MCPQPFPHTVFADKDADPFEIITVGNCTVSGLTVFGTGFEEDGDHYEKIIAQVDQTRIPSPDAAATKAAETAALVQPVQSGQPTLPATGGVTTTSPPVGDAQS